MSRSVKDRYIACMVLSGVGDALGYKNGEWEFCSSGEKIHTELGRLGGVERISVRLPDWMVSDDTVLHMATGRALSRHDKDTNKNDLYILMAEEYKTCMADMDGRSPGITCMESCRQLDPWDPNRSGYRLPFNVRGGGCGAAIRSMCIGLRYPHTDQLHDLVEVSLEAGRMTHHHPTGFLGSLASALFVTFAIQGRPIQSWGSLLLQILPMAKDYIGSKPEYHAEQNIQAWKHFENKWSTYLNHRKIIDGNSNPVFPNRFDVKKRDRFYKDISHEGIGGSSGHDSTIIAYDALLGCQGDWRELCHRSMFHGGDSDSTGTIAGALFGAVYAFVGVPDRNHRYIEYRKQLEVIAETMYRLQKRTTVTELKETSI